MPFKSHRRKDGSRSLFFEAKFRQKENEINN
jgi:hypothetical protein